MELLGTAINAVVVGIGGFLLWWSLRGRFEALEARMDRIEEAMLGLGSRLDGRIDSLRSDLTQIALAVGVQPRAENA
jgi:hypothetical protein